MAAQRIQLQSPESIDAYKIAHKKVMGVEVLNAAQQKQVYEGADGIENAKGEMGVAQGQADEACYKVDEAEDQEDKADSQEGDAKSKAQSEPTKDDMANSSDAVSASGEVAKEYVENLSSVSDEMDEYSASVLEENEAEYEIIEESNEELTLLSEEIDGLMAQLEEGDPAGGAGPDMAPAPSAPSASDGMGGVVDAKFDGTGSGKDSAYSLDIPTDDGKGDSNPDGNPDKNGGGNPFAAPSPSNPFANPGGDFSTGNPTGGSAGSDGGFENILAQVDERAARAAELQGMIEASNDNIMTNTDASTEYFNGVTETGTAITEEGDEANSKTAGVREWAQYGEEAGQLLEYAGTATKAVGLGLSTAGEALTVSGGTLSGAGAFLIGLAGGLGAIGTPLCALFGAGTPIVGAAAVTGTSGGITETSGTAMTGSGSGLTAGGEATQTVGKGIKLGGEVLKVASSATVTVCDVVDGDWESAISNGLNTVASAASCVGAAAEFAGSACTAVAESAKTVKDVADKVQKGVAIAQGLANTGTSIANGDTTGIISNGLSTLASTASFGGAFKGDTQSFFKDAGKYVTVAQNALTTTTAFIDGDYEKGITSAISTFGSGFSAVGGQDSVFSRIGTGLSSAVGVYSNGIAAYNAFEEGDIASGISSAFGTLKSGMSLYSSIDAGSKFDADLGNYLKNKIMENAGEGNSPIAGMMYTTEEEYVDENGETKTKEVSHLNGYAFAYLASNIPGAYDYVSGAVTTIQNMTMFGGGNKKGNSGNNKTATGTAYGSSGNTGLSRAEIDQILARFRGAF